MKRMQTATVFLTVLLLLTSCRVPKPPVRSLSPVPVPEAFSSSGTQEVDRWWESFDNKGLNRLMVRALAGNLNLQTAWARLAQARAVARQAGAGLYPSLSAVGSGARKRSVIEDLPIIGDHVLRTNQFKASLAAAYEVDLWGRIRSRTDAAAADARATRADVEAAALSLSATVGDVWFALVEQTAQSRLLEQQVEVSRTFLELAELRFGQGQGSALDVYQQRTQLEAVEGQKPLVASREAVLRHELGVLLGDLPQAELPEATGGLPALHALPSTGLPASLLQRRPDVRAAHARLAAADRRIAAAAAGLLPSIRMNAEAGYQSREFHELFSNPLYSIAAGLTAPLFEGGRLRAEVERSQALARQRVNEYGQVILTAFKEVENALVQEARQSDYLASLDRQVELARSQLEQAEQRYKNGLSDYLPVLTALQALQALERNRLAAQRELISFRIQLYRALGGSWTNQMTREGLPAEPDSEGA